MTVRLLYGTSLWHSIFDQPFLVAKLLNRVLLMMVGAQDATLCNFFLYAFQAEWGVYHIAYMLTLFTGIYVIKYKHVRVIDVTSFPLTYLFFKEVMKPYLVSAHICSIALIISSWVFFIVLIINSSFTWTTVWLKAITAP